MERVMISPDCVAMVPGVPIVVDIVDGDMNLLWRGVADADHRFELPVALEGGDYAVMIDFPSGVTTVAPFQLNRGPAKYFELVRATDWEDRFGQSSATPPDAAPSRSVAPDPSPRVAAAHFSIKDPRLERRITDLSETWVTLWRSGADGEWRRQAPIRGQDGPEAAPGGIPLARSLRLPPGDRFQRHYLQFGDRSKLPWVMAVPAEDITAIASPLAGPRSDAPEDAAVEIAVGCAWPEAQSLLGYSRRGDATRAGMIEGALLSRLLSRSDCSPSALALAGYQLLSSRHFDQLDRLRDHATTNGDWWMPDCPIIHAWQLMTLEGTEPSSILELVLEAARGIPLFTRGLRLLVDALDLFVQDGRFASPELTSAVERIHRYAAAANWRSPLTTFLGEHPDRPFGTETSAFRSTWAISNDAAPWSIHPWMRIIDVGSHDGGVARDEPRQSLSVPFLSAYGEASRHVSPANQSKDYQGFRRAVSSVSGEKP
jgi:hypothetical protein